jgi:hypothetical protein
MVERYVALRVIVLGVRRVGGEVDGEVGEVPGAGRRRAHVDAEAHVDEVREVVREEDRAVVAVHVRAGLEQGLEARLRVPDLVDLRPDVLHGRADAVDVLVRVEVEPAGHVHVRELVRLADVVDVEARAVGLVVEARLRALHDAALVGHVVLGQAQRRVHVADVDLRGVARQDHLAGVRLGRVEAHDGARLHPVKAARRVVRRRGRERASHPTPRRRSIEGTSPEAAPG